MFCNRVILWLVKILNLFSRSVKALQPEKKIQWIVHTVEGLHELV